MSQKSEKNSKNFLQKNAPKFSIRLASTKNFWQKWSKIGKKSFCQKLKMPQNKNSIRLIEFRPKSEAFWPEFCGAKFPLLPHFQRKFGNFGEISPNLLEILVIPRKIAKRFFRAISERKSPQYRQKAEKIRKNFKFFLIFEAKNLRFFAPKVPIHRTQPGARSAPGEFISAPKERTRSTITIFEENRGLAKRGRPRSQPHFPDFFEEKIIKNPKKSEKMTKKISPFLRKEMKKGNFGEISQTPPEEISERRNSPKELGKFQKKFSLMKISEGNFPSPFEKKHPPKEIPFSPGNLLKISEKFL